MAAGRPVPSLCTLCLSLHWDGGQHRHSGRGRDGGRCPAVAEGGEKLAEAGVGSSEEAGCASVLCVVGKKGGEAGQASMLDIGGEEQGGSWVCISVVFWKEGSAHDKGGNTMPNSLSHIQVRMLIGAAARTSSYVNESMPSMCARRWTW